ncbi:MAG: hypothetical protein ABIL76_07165 [candidate division WOR-3 bacterium]
MKKFVLLFVVILNLAGLSYSKVEVIVVSTSPYRQALRFVDDEGKEIKRIELGKSEVASKINISGRMFDSVFSRVKKAKVAGRYACLLIEEINAPVMTDEYKDFLGISEGAECWGNMDEDLLIIELYDDMGNRLFRREMREGFFGVYEHNFGVLENGLVLLLWTDMIEREVIFNIFNSSGEVIFEYPCKEARKLDDGCPSTSPLFLERIYACSSDGRYVAFEAGFYGWLGHHGYKSIIVDTVNNKELILEYKDALVYSISNDGIAKVDYRDEKGEWKVIKIDLKEMMK